MQLLPGSLLPRGPREDVCVWKGGGGLICSSSILKAKRCNLDKHVHCGDNDQTLFTRDILSHTL